MALERRIALLRSAENWLPEFDVDCDLKSIVVDEDSAAEYSARFVREARVVAR